MSVIRASASGEEKEARNSRMAFVMNEIKELSFPKPCGLLVSERLLAHVRCGNFETPSPQATQRVGALVGLAVG